MQLPSAGERYEANVQESLALNNDVVLVRKTRGIFNDVVFAVKGAAQDVGEWTKGAAQDVARWTDVATEFVVGAKKHTVDEEAGR